MSTLVVKTVSYQNYGRKGDGQLPVWNVEQPLIPPITRLPPEIVCEVFHHYLSVNTNGLLTPNRIPLLLSQICTFWRRIALSTPQLWSSLTVSVYANFCSPDITLVDAWLGRSGLQPLSLALTYVDFPVDMIPANMMELLREPLNDVLAIFRSHIRRWKHIYLSLLDIRPDHIFPPEFSSAPDGAPLLETADIFVPFSWYGQTAWLSSVFECAPRLYSFTGGAVGTTMLAIPLVQLTHIDLDAGLSILDCIKILSQTPILVDCKLQDVIFRHDVHPGPLIHLNWLRSLYISSHLHLASLFDRLLLPALHHLTIHTFGREANLPAWPQSEFTSLMLRSSCSISTFDVRNSITTSDNYVESLQLLGSLVDLTIYEDAFVTANLTDEVLALLIHNGAASSLCPKLERIRLHKCISATDGVVADMILSRCRPDYGSSDQPSPYPRLQHVEIGLPQSHLEDIRKLEALSQEGVVHLHIERDREQKQGYWRV